MNMVDSKCAECGVQLPVPTLDEQIQLVQNYREYYDETWQDEPDPKRVCMPCFERINR